MDNNGDNKDLKAVTGMDINDINIEEIKHKLETDMKPKRFVHSVNVMDTASRLADFYGVDRKKAEVAAILHDCARNMDKADVFETCRKYGIEVDEIQRRQPDLLHGPIAACIAKFEYGIKDEDVLEAIRVHTTGKENMTMLDKIIFIADYIEPGRDFPGVENIREWAYKDIDKAILLALESTIGYVIQRGMLLHPDTIYTRNYIIMSMQDAGK